MKGKFTSTVAGASIFITIFTLFGRSLGFLREIVFAGYFGTNQNFEVYLVAAVLPTTINIILLVLAQNYFIPNYYKFDLPDKKDFVNHSINSFFFSSILLSLILYIFSDELINFYVNVSSTDARNTALIIYKLYLLTIPPSALISILYAFLQAEKNFTVPVISNLFINIFIIFAVPFFTGSIGVYIIPISYLLGVAAQAIYLIMIVRKKIKIKISPFFLKTGLRTKLGNFFFFTLLIEFIGQMFVIVDRFFLDKVQRGGIAALNYSLTLYQLPIVILPFAAVLFPSFSELIQKDEMRELKNKVDKSIAMLIFLTTPIAFIFIFYGDFLIDIFLQRGSFSFGDVSLTFETFKLYSVSLIFYAVYSVLNKLLYSAKLLKLLLLITISSLIAKTVLSYFLVDKLFQNGLALSTSICFIFLCFASLIAVSTLKLETLGVFFRNLLLYLMNAYLCLFIITIFRNLIHFRAGLGLLLEIILFLALFLFNCFVLKDNSFRLFINLISALLNGDIFSKKSRTG